MIFNRSKINRLLIKIFLNLNKIKRNYKEIKEFLFIVSKLLVSFIFEFKIKNYFIVQIFPN